MHVPVKNSENRSIYDQVRTKISETYFFKTPCILFSVKVHVHPDKEAKFIEFLIPLEK